MMIKRSIGGALCALALTAAPIFAQSPDTATTRVYFISPQDGETLSSPVTVRFGLSGMGVAPAGTPKDNTGHHHLLIDVNDLPDLSMPLPSDENHRHFGGGQTEAVIELTPGAHTLQLVLGDASHIPHKPPVMSDKISITVE